MRFQVANTRSSEEKTSLTRVERQDNEQIDRVCQAEQVQAHTISKSVVDLRQCRFNGIPQIFDPNKLSLILLQLRAFPRVRRRGTASSITVTGASANGSLCTFCHENPILLLLVYIIIAANVKIVSHLLQTEQRKSMVR